MIKASPMPTPDHLLAVCGPNSLVIYNFQMCCNVELYRHGNYKLIEWSRTAKHLACIRDSDNKVVLFFISAIGKLEHTEMELANSENACYLSFSPCENWLIVGLRNLTGGNPEFMLYTLASGEDDLHRPKKFTLGMPAKSNEFEIGLN